MSEKRNEFENLPVEKLLVKLAIPSIIAQLVKKAHEMQQKQR